MVEVLVFLCIEAKAVIDVHLEVAFVFSGNVLVILLGSQLCCLFDLVVEELAEGRRSAVPVESVVEVLGGEANLQDIVHRYVIGVMHMEALDEVEGGVVGEDEVAAVAGGGVLARAGGAPVKSPATESVSLTQFPTHAT